MGFLVKRHCQQKPWPGWQSSHMGIFIYIKKDSSFYIGYMQQGELEHTKKDGNSQVDRGI